jgi:hypothetical protein
VTGSRLDWSDSSSTMGVLRGDTYPHLKSLTCSVDAVQCFALQESLTELVLAPSITAIRGILDSVRLNSSFYSNLQSLTIRLEVSLWPPQSFKALVIACNKLEVLDIMTTFERSYGSNGYDSGNFDDLVVRKHFSACHLWLSCRFTYRRYSRWACRSLCEYCNGTVHGCPGHMRNTAFAKCNPTSSLPSRTIRQKDWNASGSCHHWSKRSSPMDVSAPSLGMRDYFSISRLRRWRSLGWR